jgi:cell wall-associated NlpC family hydrolase
MRHVSSPQPGDLVFFAGSPIDPPPGHVGIVVSPARHLMIDAYGAGTVVRYDRYGPRATAPGLQNVVGFTEAGAG